MGVKTPPFPTPALVVVLPPFCSCWAGSSAHKQKLSALLNLPGGKISYINAVEVVTSRGLSLWPGRELRGGPSGTAAGQWEGRQGLLNGGWFKCSGRSSLPTGSLCHGSHSLSRTSSSPLAKALQERGAPAASLAPLVMACPS